MGSIYLCIFVNVAKYELDIKHFPLNIRQQKSYYIIDILSNATWKIMTEVLH